jgi:hypothetical protein
VAQTDRPAQPNTTHARRLAGPGNRVATGEKPVAGT